MDPTFLQIPRMYTITLFFLLLIYLMSIYFSDQLEEPIRVEEKFFLPNSLIRINHKNETVSSVFPLQGTVLSISNTLSHLTLTAALQGGYYFPQFSNKDAKCQSI